MREKKKRKWNNGEPLDGQGKTISSGSRREYSASAVYIERSQESSRLQGGGGGWTIGSISFWTTAASDCCFCTIKSGGYFLLYSLALKVYLSNHSRTHFIQRNCCRCVYVSLSASPSFLSFSISNGFFSLFFFIYISDPPALVHKPPRTCCVDAKNNLSQQKSLNACLPSCMP